MSTGSQTITFSIDRLHPGTTLAGPIYEDSEGTILLLQAGVCVTEEQIDQLRNRGIQQIRIEKRFADALFAQRRPSGRAIRPRRPTGAQAAKAEKMVPPIGRPAAKATWSAQLSQSVEKLRGAQSEKLANVYSLLDNQGGFDATVLDEIGQESIDQLSVDMDLFIKGSIQPQLSEAASEHCVRVSQLAVAVGAMAGHTREELRWLAMGCLVSRCCATESARELSEEPRRLTAVEFAEIKRTPGRVFDMLSTIDFPLVGRTVAYQIHERWNGTGYPRKKAGVQIHPLARIAGVCDAYVSLSSPRPHRAAFSLYAAVVQILADARAGLFDPHSIRCFLRTVSLYPIGAYVRLNTGQLGRVVRTSPDAYDRPTIEIVGETPANVIALVEAPDVQVVEVIDPEQAAEEIFVPQAGQLDSNDINLLLGLRGS
ncbi:MAG TPA: HD domain-containing phosphohydrolase [Planctomycetaceae bacterium]|jgi:HD-GYP domain-containing protein (c-di-GMP phosphodiesterase class II)|nr:HD domain-containing phosphohydrolase [Planctomycetaceae bacterium]